MFYASCRHFERRLRCLSSFNRRPPPPPGNSLDLKEFKYVDKTHFLAQILSKEQPQFIHAPAMRRIGKSTTIDMLEEMVKGNREPFEGYAVNKPDSPFQIGEQKFVCIKLDVSTVADKKYTASEILERFNKELVAEAKEQHNLIIDKHDCAGDTLASWLRALTQDSDTKIVLLIDEYDSPCTEFLPEFPDRAEDIVEMIRPFYRMIKKKGELFHKVFVTGVARFSATSMFSDANQFWPLMEKSAHFCNLYGFTEKELRETYGVNITQVFGKPLEEMIAKMAIMYNGYCFHPDQDERTYNPMSILSALHSGKLGPHWARTATSSTIVDTIGTRGMEVLRGVDIQESELFAAVSTANYLENWKQVMFQTGYATIADVKRRGDYEADLVLRPPNEEVRRALMEGFAEKLMKTVSVKRAITAYAKCLQQLDFDGAQDNLRNVFNTMKPSALPETEGQLSGYVISMLHKCAGFELVYNDVPQKLDDEPTSRGRLIESEPEHPHPNPKP